MEREISIFNSGQPHKGAKGFKCPRCNHFSQQYPALSRADNKTNICSPCGTDEALFCMVHTRKEFFEHSNQWLEEAGLETVVVKE